MKITIGFEVRPFPIPDGIYVVQPARPRQEGFKPAAAVPLGDVDDDTLRKLCDEFRDNVLKAARDQRNVPAAMEVGV